MIHNIMWGRSVFGGEPVGALAEGDVEGHTAVVGVTHAVDHEGAHGVKFVGIDVEDEFVVNLHYHTRTEASTEYLAVYFYHGHFDDVGGTALKRGVYGIALGKAAHYGVARVDVGKHTFATLDGGDIAVASGRLYGTVNVFTNSRIGGEVTVNKHLGLRARYAEAFGESEGRYAVDDAEVGGLCVAALIVGDTLNRLMVDTRGCAAMDVVARKECVYHILVAREVSYEAQLYLGVVGVEKYAPLVGHEGATYLASVIGTYGYVLQIGIGG